MKKAILYRKSSLFYKTVKGAEVGDLFMPRKRASQKPKARHILGQARRSAKMLSDVQYDFKLEYTPEIPVQGAPEEA